MTYQLKYAMLVLVMTWIIIWWHVIKVALPVWLNISGSLYDALEGLAVVVNRVTCFVSIPGSTLYVHACHPRGALPTPGLAGCPVGHEK
jgi:hypothetical protein